MERTVCSMSVIDIKFSSNEQYSFLKSWTLMDIIWLLFDHLLFSNN